MDILAAAFLQLRPADWSVAECTFLIAKFLSTLKSIALDARRRVSIFVDECDRPCISALNHPNFALFNQFFRELPVVLKAEEFLPFMFITGSSRLAI